MVIRGSSISTTSARARVVPCRQNLAAGLACARRPPADEAEDRGGDADARGGEAETEVPGRDGERHLGGRALRQPCVQPSCGTRAAVLLAKRPSPPRSKRPSSVGQEGLSSRTFRGVRKKKVERFAKIEIGSRSSTVSDGLSCWPAVT